jgi:flagellar protein FliL
MAAKSMEAPKPAAEPAKGAEAKTAEPAAAKSGGGLGAWLPLIAMTVLMPVIAYAMTTFVMVPKLKKTMAGGTEEAAAEAPASSSHAEKAEPAKHGEAKGGEAKKSEGKKEKSEGKKGGEAGKKAAVPMEKIYVTIAGTQGSRYLLVKMTLVGANEAFKDKADECHDQLIDAASSTLSTKTLNDIEKPGGRNLIKTELIQALNGIMGNDAVQDIYFTEFATQ